MVAPICLNFGITAPVLSCVITWRGRIETKSPLRTTVLREQVHPHDVPQSSQQV